MHQQKLGRLGEALAKKILLKKGYRFLSQNFRSKFGEVDLIFLDKETLLFVEVKTRIGSKLGTPEEAITPWKIQRLIKTAQYFQLKNPHLTQDCRLDVVAVQFDEETEKLIYIKHYKNITL